MGNAISTITNFDPETWADTNTSTTPVKGITVGASKVLELLSPYIKIISSQFQVIKNIILENKILIESLVIIFPSIPVIYLVMYFTDTL